MSNKTKPAAASRRGRKPERVDRTEDIVRIASVIFNARGAPNTRVQHITEAVRLTRAAFYYYFPDIETLAYASYERSASIFLEGCKLAARTGRTGLEKVLITIEHLCREEILSSIAVIELEALKPEHANIVGAIQGEASGLFVGFLRLGVRDGSIADDVVDAAAYAILGIMSSAVLNHQSHAALPADLVRESLVRFVKHGLRPKGAAATAITFPNFIGPAFDMSGFDREAQARLKRESIVRAATILFNRYGVNQVTLDDVVRELNVTKGAFYRYVKTKDELLRQCFERSLDLADYIVLFVERMKLSPALRLAAYAYYCVVAHNGPSGPFSLFLGSHDLPDEAQRALSRRAGRLARSFESWIAEGQALADVRDDEATVLKLAFDGALHWIPRWSFQQPANDLSPEALAGSFSRLLLNGLSPRR